MSKVLIQNVFFMFPGIEDNPKSQTFLTEMLRTDQLLLQKSALFHLNLRPVSVFFLMAQSYSDSISADIVISIQISKLVFFRCIQIMFNSIYRLNNVKDEKYCTTVYHKLCLFLVE